METGEIKNMLLFFIPFISVLLGGWMAGYVPDSSAVGRFFAVITEKDLPELMKRNGFERTGVIAYEVVRIVIAAFMAFTLPGILDIGGLGYFATVIVILFAAYKAFYIYLKYMDSQRIRRLNMVLPYTVKSIAYLAEVYPVNNALVRSVELVPDEFKGDIKILCEDIDKDPVSFAPYQKFIDAYGGRLQRLDYYLKTLYRMSMSASREESKLLSGLNATISSEMAEARRQKNDAVNSTVSYLGLIPVGLLTAMLVYLMMNVVNTLCN